MRRLFLCLGCIISQLIVWAQPALKKEYNLFRANDYLFRQQVKFINPGEPGESLLWDFSNLKVIDEKYKVSYSDFPDSLFIARELRTLYKYALKGDTLVSTGIESNLLLMEYVHPEMQLIYPVGYSDKKENIYYGTGDYCKEFNLIHSGVSAYHADAWGEVLLPEGDTLKQVLRVKHTRKQIEDKSSYFPFVSDIHFSTDTILLRLATDTLWTQTDTYRWYAEGYRYPIFESIEYFIYRHGTPELAAATSFYHSPYEQYYGMEDDPENREKREWIAMQKENEEKQMRQKKQHSQNREVELPTPYVIQYDTRSETVAINYEIAEPTEFSLMLVDVLGRVLLQTPVKRKEEGFYKEELQLNDYHRNEYILYIGMGDKIYSEKIIN